MSNSDVRPREEEVRILCRPHQKPRCTTAVHFKLIFTSEILHVLGANSVRV